MKIHTVISHLTISTLVIAAANVYAGDWQISCIAEGNNLVYLIPKDSLKDTGIGSKSAEIIAINRDRTDTIEYRKNLRYQNISKSQQRTVLLTILI